MDSVAVVPSARTVIALRAPVGTDEAARDDELIATDELILDDDTTTADELEREELVVGVLLVEPAEHKVPLICGRSAVPPFLVP